MNLQYGKVYLVQWPKSSTGYVRCTYRGGDDEIAIFEMMEPYLVQIPMKWSEINVKDDVSVPLKSIVSSVVNRDRLGNEML